MTERLGWSLVHFLWQGAAAAGLLHGLLVLLRHRSPGARYLASCAALLLMVALAVITFLVLGPREAGSGAAEGPGAASPGFHLAGGGRPLSLQQPPHRRSEPVMDLVGSMRENIGDLVRPVLPWLVRGWLAGVFLLSLGLLGGWLRLRGIRGRARPITDGVWEERLRALASRLGMARAVRLLESFEVEVPSAMGILRPAILLPLSSVLGLSPRHLEVLIAHELAHVRRFDPLVNLLQACAETLLFYHPAVWWVSRRIRAEREICCDDLAIGACGDRIVYAQALTALVEMRLEARRLAVASSGGSLLDRIRRLAGLAPEVPLRRMSGLAFCILGLLLPAMLVLSTAREGPRAAGEPPASGLQGTIGDLAGRAIAGARIAAQEPGGARTVLRSDAQGRFQLPRPGPAVLTVQASGFAPLSERRLTGGEKGPLELRLERGRLIRARVVDGSGKPVAGAAIGVGERAGISSLTAGGLRTDAQGHFVWDQAPTGPVYFDVAAEGFMSIRNKALFPLPGEQVLVLRPPLRIRGRVLDRRTGEPVRAFGGLHGVDRVDGRFLAFEHCRFESRDGRFDVTIDMPFSSYLYPVKGYAVRVEAEGYEHGLTRLFGEDEGEQTCDIELEEAGRPRGRVLGPGGKPLAGVRVVLAGEGSRVRLEGASLAGGEEGERAAIAETDSGGRFAFPVTRRPCLAAAAHETGYGEAPAEALLAAPDLVLAPWGSLSGTLAPGSNPPPGAVVELARVEDARREPRISLPARRLALDGGGTFHARHLPPGSYRLGILAPEGASHRLHGAWSTVEVRAGEAARPVLDGWGARVEGKLRPPAGLEGRVDWNAARLSLRPGPEAGAASDARPGSRSTTLVPSGGDGAFRFEGLPAGSYALHFSAYEERPRRGTARIPDEIAFLDRTFRVSLVAGEAGGRLDLGLLQAEPRKLLRVGEPAPAFSAKTLEGGTLALGDFRGRHVLLDFWATWCGPCLAQVPHLRRAQESFGEDGRLVVIGLSLDQEIDAPREYARKNGIPWRQGFLGPKAPVLEEYGVTSIPRIFLIGPDGKLLSRDLLGDEIVWAAMRALEGGR